MLIRETRPGADHVGDDVNAAGKVSRLVVEPFARKVAVPVMMDLAGFWLLWHVEGRL